MDTFEKDIRARIAEIDDAIEKLKGEKQTLEHLLYTRTARARASEVSDRRSYKRIYNEEKIRLLLSSTPRGLRLKELSRRLLLQNVIIKEPTLRSYLTRMAKKDILEHNPSTGIWRASSSASP
jgi:hypothetical protein